MFESFILFAVLIAEEPDRAIIDSGVRHFIESQRTSSNGPGKILAAGTGHYDSDHYPDKLIVYTYAHGPNHGDKAFGMFAVAFLTENFDSTEILFIPESDMVSERLLGYSNSGNELTLRGEKRLPGDAMCCPSGITTITLSVVNGKVAVLKGDYSRQPDQE